MAGSVARLLHHYTVVEQQLAQFALERTTNEPRGAENIVLSVEENSVLSGDGSQSQRSLLGTGEVDAHRDRLEGDEVQRDSCEQQRPIKTPKSESPMSRFPLRWVDYMTNQLRLD